MLYPVNFVYGKFNLKTEFDANNTFQKSLRPWKRLGIPVISRARPPIPQATMTAARAGRKAGPKP